MDYNAWMYESYPKFLEKHKNKLGSMNKASIDKGIIDQIVNRLSTLKTASKNFPELLIFLEQTFEPLWVEVKDENYYLWPIESRDSSLPREKQTLSPSDFGFHNAIRRGDG